MKNNHLEINISSLAFSQYKTKPPSSRKSPIFFDRIKSRHVTEFIRQLATLVQMRLPLTQSLGIVVEQAVNEKFKKILLDCKARVEQGQNLADAFEAHSKVFPQSVIKFTAVGELTGRLGDALGQVADQLEKIARLRRKLITALSYPAVVLFVATAAISFLLIFVVPTFSEVFRDFGAELPAATKLLLAAGNFLLHRWYMILAVIVGILAMLWEMWHRPRLRVIMERILWRSPIIGPIVHKEQISRFTRTLGTMLANGILLPNALHTSGQTSGSLTIARSVQAIAEKVKRGVSLNRALQGERFYPAMMIQMVRVGEETGCLGQMLIKTAEYYESEIDAAIETLNAVLEPIIIVGLGIVLGAILIAMYMQIFSVVDVIQ